MCMCAEHKDEEAGNVRVYVSVCSRMNCWIRIRHVLPCWWMLGGGVYSLVRARAMQAGRDPRTDEPVYLSYTTQFGPAVQPPAEAEPAPAPAARGKGAAKEPTKRGGAQAAAAAQRGATDGEPAGAAGAGKGAKKRGRGKKAAAEAEGEGAADALGSRERRLLGDIDMDDEFRVRDRGGGAGGDRRMEWAQVGQPALPAGRSTFSRTRPAAANSIHVYDGMEGASWAAYTCRSASCERRASETNVVGTMPQEFPAMGRSCDGSVLAASKSVVAEKLISR